MGLTMHPSLAVHPGDWLWTEVVRPYGQNVSTMARHFGVSRQAMSALFNGHAALSAVMAIRFEKAFGVKAETLMRMQARYDLAQARAHEDKLEVGRLELT